MILIVIYFICCIGSGCESIENGWKNIRPLETDRSVVDRLFGDPEFDDNGYASYKIDGGHIQINFSTLPCVDDPYKRGKYRVAKDTVLGYTVYLHDGLNISRIKFKRADYYRDTSGDITTRVSYVSDRKGIALDASIIQGEEIVSRISFRPTAENQKKFTCSE